jgi:hypothetical protein
MPYSKFNWASDECISLDAVTTGTGRALQFNDCRHVRWFVETDSAPDAGVVAIEWAHSEDYAEAWNLLESITVTEIVAGTPARTVTAPGPIGFVRARVTTTVTNGTVTVRINGLLG